MSQQQAKIVRYTETVVRGFIAAQDTESKAALVAINALIKVRQIYAVIDECHHRRQCGSSPWCCLVRLAQEAEEVIGPLEGITCSRGAESNDDMVCCSQTHQEEPQGDKWFHLGCVGLTWSTIPAGDWNCPYCEAGGPGAEETPATEKASEPKEKGDEEGEVGGEAEDEEEKKESEAEEPPRSRRQAPKAVSVRKQVG